ncbi:MAG: hypothetical protein H6659_07615 [Ardenticatenaceae bacterium]|nr:hypothetical protein [Ardenticatenaceae bacterium]
MKTVNGGQFSVFSKRYAVGSGQWMAVWVVGLLIVLMGCGGETAVPTPPPTSAPNTPQAPATAVPLAIAETDSDTAELPLFDDVTAAGWTLANSWGVAVDDRANNPVHDGLRAIAVTPQEEYGGLFLNADSVSGAGFRRSRFLGLRFWLNPGSQPMPADSLALGLVGSDEFTYWSRDTSSAPQQNVPFTSEIPLARLGLSGELPANTWTPVEVWFQQLDNQPSYPYLIGLYLKNSADLTQTYYVDDVALIALRDKTPPVIVAVSNTDRQTALVEFNEDVVPQEAADRGNYRVDGVVPDSASYEPATRQARLAFATPLAADTPHTLTASGIHDLGLPPNEIAGDTAVPFTLASLTISVDAEQVLHPISPYIYGMAGPPRDYIESLGITFHNWGGNPNSRYNWQLGNAWNAARDWYYLNVDYGHAAGISASDEFVQTNNELGVASHLTIPTLGWVAKDTAACSFPLPDGTCGDAAGASCDKPGDIADPTQTSIAAPPEFMADWVRHLVEEMGYTVEFLSLDNEPELWGVTHYDVHPECVTYDEIFEKYVAYATAVHDISPQSQLVGPNTCCWWYYWNSMAGDADKRAHDNADFLPWFLQEMAAYEANTGTRLLNVLGIHYYPAGLYSDDVDPEVADRRLRATASLWDPTYVDESWIGEPVYLIPRMLALIESTYPGTKLGISEWNFGAEETLNGAMTIADALGIFGREGLYFASYWRFPPENSPGYFAFKMFTNFDDAGGRFGDTAVFAQSTDPTSVSAFAALDGETGNLHVMLINKQPNDPAQFTVNLANYDMGETATLYRYSEAHIGRIVSEEISVGESFEMTLPPYSITLLVLENGT